ncbi:helicase associated domain-containing protein [Diaminobutyricimonas sp. LJ205]|uniref:helicase associated domain-containing protein n=1 Tax=Diaminobutyricimonas sp. LJ205 TaxID=2683590 RepID=UPI0012F4D896|nr:helicase associated domain-containing protein [Diaminobutyricimonas sp. LJ205]
MSGTTPLGRLHAKYAEISLRDDRDLTPDDRRSLLYYRADITPEQSSMESGSGPALWVRRIRELDAFVARAGRMPRENNRLPRAHISVAERRAAAWVRDQRKAIGLQQLVSYQIERLDCVPGYSHSPLDERWNARRDTYRDFTVTRGHAPAYRSIDQAERSLAAWADKQRMYYWKKTLPDRRVRSLEQLPTWTWGSRPPTQ